MKKKIIISISAFTALILLAMSVTYAWFVNYTSNKIIANKLTASTSTSFLVSTSPDGPFSTLITYDFTGLKLDDVTGDGKTFMLPVMLSELDAEEHGQVYTGLYSSVPDTDADWPEAVSTDGKTNLDTAQYISVDFYFQASSKMNVYLGADSFIKPVSKILTGTDPVPGNKSAYGDFSLDCIAGAVRLSVLDMSSDSGEVKFIWIPNSQYELSYSQSDGWSMDTESGTPEDDESLAEWAGYYYFDENKNQNYLQPLGSAKGGYVKDLGSTGKFITTLQETAEGSGVFQGHIKVNIWIEGCDREARRALSGGQIDVQLDFTANEAEE